MQHAADSHPSAAGEQADVATGAGLQKSQQAPRYWMAASCCPDALAGQHFETHTEHPKQRSKHPKILEGCLLLP